MEKISLTRIGKKGLTLTLDQNEPWVISMLNRVLGGDVYDKDSVTGEAQFSLTGDVVFVQGRLSFKHHPSCAHCGKTLDIPQKISFHANQAPLFNSPTHKKKNQNDEEELELTADDLEFHFYKNDEIEIESLINDEIALAMPYNFYCRDKSNCKTQPISADETVTVGDSIDPRWMALKNLKKTTKAD